MEITITRITNTDTFQAVVTFPGSEPFTVNNAHKNPNYALALLLEELQSIFRANGWCEKCGTFHQNKDRGESWNNAGLCPSCYEALGF